MLINFRKPAATGCGLFLLLLLSATDACAALRFAVFGVGTRGSLVYPSSANEPRWALGAGASIEIPLAARAGLELGGVWLNRKLADTTVSPALSTTYTFLEVPLQFRVAPFRFLSLGAGAYFANAIGNIQSDSGATAYRDAGFRRVDYGLVGSARVTFLPSKGFSPFFEGRYTYGLADVIDHSVADALDPALASQKGHLRDFQALLGLRIGASP